MANDVEDYHIGRGEMRRMDNFIEGIELRDGYSGKQSIEKSDSYRKWKKLAEKWLYNFVSEHTRRNYRRALEQFFFIYVGHPEEVLQSDVIAYRNQLERKGLAQATINQYLAGLASFYRAAQEAGLIEVNPVNGVKRMNVSPYGRATSLQEGQDKQLLDAIDTSTVMGKRDRAIILLMLTTAVRVSVIASLKLGDIRQQGSVTYMKFRNKGGEDIERKLPKFVVQEIVKYTKTRDKLTDKDFLFVRTIEPALSDYPTRKRDLKVGISVRSVQRMIGKYGDKAFGEGHGITPHSLRHTAAMNALKAGATVPEISQLLSHRDVGITSVYIQHADNGAANKLTDDLAKKYE